MTLDALDEVILAFQREKDAAGIHEGMLAVRAELLVNLWQSAIKAILSEMKPKLLLYDIGFTSCVGQFSNTGSASGATLTIKAGVPFNSPLKTLGCLVMKLEKSGKVRLRLSPPSNSPLFEEREFEVTSSFPEHDIKQALADYVGVCLRHRERG